MKNKNTVVKQNDSDKNDYSKPIAIQGDRNTPKQQFYTSVSYQISHSQTPQYQG